MTSGPSTSPPLLHAHNLNLVALAPSPLGASWALPENIPIEHLLPLQDPSVWPFSFSKFVPMVSAFVSPGIPLVFTTTPAGYTWILS